LAKTGLGKESWIHERAINNPPFELALGIVDSQRTAWDTDKVDPALIARSGLRWYKNRVVLAYDMDSKELTSAWKIPGYTGTQRDGRRMLLTMAYVAASRLLLANSFRDLDKETLADLERTFPYPKEPRSARPIDAFTKAGWPEVYDFEVEKGWHQVTLFNSDLPTKSKQFRVPMSKPNVLGGLGLNRKKQYWVYDFWNDALVGMVSGSKSLVQSLRPGEARMLSVREVMSHPQVISTNRHIMQGAMEWSRRPTWNAINRSLSGTARVVVGETYTMVLALNGWRIAQTRGAIAKVLPGGMNAQISIRSATNGESNWACRFTR